MAQRTQSSGQEQSQLGAQSHQHYPRRGSDVSKGGDSGDR